MDVATRSLTVANAGPDLTTLATNGFNLQVAKSVAKGGKRALIEIQLLQYELIVYTVIFNIVWQSKVLAPKINVKWKPIYGLNWTTVMTPVPFSFAS